MKGQKNFKSFKLIGDLKYESVDYGEKFTEGFIPIGKTNLPDNFYGGTTTALAKTDTEGLYLVMSGTTPIDILIDTQVIKEAKTTSKKKAE